MNPQFVGHHGYERKHTPSSDFKYTEKLRSLEKNDLSELRKF